MHSAFPQIRFDSYVKTVPTSIYVYMPDIVAIWYTYLSKPSSLSCWLIEALENAFLINEFIKNAA